MKNKRIFLAIAILLTVFSISANEVTKKEIIKVASNFYHERASEFIMFDTDKSFIGDVYEKEFNEKVVFYTINYTNGGWIIIAASDAVNPVIAYSYTGKYDPNFEPQNFHAWTLQYADQISDAVAQNKISDSYVKEQWEYYLADDISEIKNYKKGRSIEPLVYSTWDQGLYYNEMCPPDASGQGGHCLTGCVPTCMGQIANYFRWPNTGVGEYSYDGGAYGTLSANFGESTYNWNEMAVSLSTNSLETAEILYHFGVSCDLVYGPDGSGMYNHKAAYALRTFFKYSPETQYLYRDSTNLNWDSVIIAHLDQKIPLYYAGWSVPNINGHAFVCDGYENDDYFHFNWGWSGSYDGYFYTGNLNPGGSNFNLAQELIINCFPDTTNYTYPNYNTSVDTMTTVTGTLDDGSGPVYNYLNNLNAGWLISPEDSIVSISLEFHIFNVSAGDTLYVHDGNSNGAPIISALSGVNIPDIITSSGTELYLEFITNSDNTSEGWLASYSSEVSVYCSGNTFITEPSGTLTDGSGSADYHNLTTCIWIVNPGTGEDIKLEFNEFETEPDHDFLTIYDGSNQVGAFSGSDLPDEITATEGSLTLVFSTNSSITAQGWTADYYTLPVSVDANNFADNFYVYPVPADNKIVIDSDTRIDEIEVYNSYGINIASMKDVFNESTTINTSKYQNGVYIIKIHSGNDILSKRIIISH